MAKFTYANFSPASLEIVMATSVWAYADNASAEPRHLRRALTSRPPDALQADCQAASARDSGVFTAELKAVLVKATELTAGPIEPAHLNEALGS